MLPVLPQDFGCYFEPFLGSGALFFSLKPDKAVLSDMSAELVNAWVGLKDHFDELYDQSQFLYLELLMSQKDQILGKELHADSKMSKVTDKEAFSGWSRKTQSWEDNKFEYWWDEIGFHVSTLGNVCR